MRTVDRYVGVPLCWLTGLWNSIRSSPPTPPNLVLVTKFFGLGSILLATPFLEQLRNRFPFAQITFLSFDSNKELLERLPLNLNVRTISTNTIQGFLVDTLRVIRDLRRQGIDTTFDLEFFSKFSTLISVFSGARTRIGYDLPTKWRRSNITHSIPLERSLHVTRVFLQQLRIFGVEAEPRVLQLAATENERRAMREKLHLRDGNTEVITINMNAGSTSLERRWMPERFIEVVKKLLEQNRSRHFFFIGNADERGYIGNALAAHPEFSDRATNCAGQLTLGELLALFKRSSFVLTNDSGPMHLAAATGAKVVALFGPESPDFYGPIGDVRVIYKGIECSPCLNIYNAKLFVCPYQARCMKEISVDEVVSAIHSLESIPHHANA